MALVAFQVKHVTLVRRCRSCPLSGRCPHPQLAGVAAHQQLAGVAGHPHLAGVATHPQFERALPLIPKSVVDAVKPEVWPWRRRPELSSIRSAAQSWVCTRQVGLLLKSLSSLISVYLGEG